MDRVGAPEVCRATPSRIDHEYRHRAAECLIVLRVEYSLDFGHSAVGINGLLRVSFRCRCLTVSELCDGPAHIGRQRSFEADG